MESHTPKRSHIRRLDYDPDTRKLSVTFSTNGKTYIHGGVGPNVWAAMKTFPHPGSYYHRFIKDRYKLLTTAV